MTVTLVGVLVIVAAVLFWVRSDRAVSADEPLVLGQQIADAQRAEDERLARGPAGPSPIAGASYTAERGEYDLLRVTPLAVDETIRAFVRAYSTQGGAERAAMRDALSMDDLYALIHFAKRSAVLALNDRDASACADGAFALASLAENRVDPRDAGWAAGILAHAADTLGDLSGPFEAAAAVATPPVAELLRRTARSEPNLADWGYRQIEFERRVGLVSAGFGDYAPTTPLFDHAVAVSKLAREGDYATAQIEVASELPSVWFDAGRRAEVESILASSPATVQVRADLRASAHDEAGSQMWVAWLVETASAEQARKLADSVAPGDRSGRIGVGGHDDRVFFVIVAGSYVTDVAAYESADSLGHQRDAILAAIRSVAD